MNTMQYRDYIFPHNPQSITVTQQSGTVAHFCPGKGDVVQNLGRGARTVRCTGSFFGGSYEQAAAHLEQFRERSAGGEPGVLFLPGMAPFQAYLRELVFEAAGDGRIIPYTMVFVEAEVEA